MPWVRLPSLPILGCALFPPVITSGFVSASDDSAEFNQVTSALISIFKIDAKGKCFFPVSLWQIPNDQTTTFIATYITCYLRSNSAGCISCLCSSRHFGRPLFPDPAGGGHREGEGHQVSGWQTENTSRGCHDEGGGGICLCRDKEG